MTHRLEANQENKCIYIYVASLSVFETSKKKKPEQDLIIPNDTINSKTKSAATTRKNKEIERQRERGLRHTIPMIVTMREIFLLK